MESSSSSTRRSVSQSIWAAPAPARKSLAVAILYRIERTILRMEYSKLRRAHRKEPDSWWAGFRGRAHGPLPFEMVLKLQLEAAPTLKIVHVSLGEQTPVPWKTVSYSAWWSNRQTAAVWTVGFWVSLLVFGWVAVCLGVPSDLQLALQVAYWVVAGGTTLKHTSLGKELDFLGGQIFEQFFKQPKRSPETAPLN